MANLADPILSLAAEKRDTGKWDKAMASIFYFIDHYVPARIFSLKLASAQQIEMLQAVQDGHQYFIIRAPRKGGKTILVAIVAVWLTLRDQTFRFFIVSGSEAQAKWLYDYCRTILQPTGPQFAERRAFFRQFLKREPKNQITEYKAGGWIMYTAATSKKVNAPTSDAVGMDEFVLIPDQIVQEAWPMNRSSKKPMRFLLSTATDGKENTDAFLDILDDCEPGRPLHEKGWMKFEWTSEDSPHLNTEAALEDAESAAYFLSDDMYRTQYEGGLPKRAGRVFPRTFIREAFVAPDPDNPGFLLDGTPYNPEDPDNPGFLVDGTPIDANEVEIKDKPWVTFSFGLEFQGDSKGGIDWGFDHDTVFIEGYRALGGKIVIMRMLIGNGTSPSDWADQAEQDALDHSIQEWYADAAGAFQNQEIRDRGFRVISRAFQRQTYGKEWMIGIVYYWLSKRKFVIPDTPEFAPLKRQLLKWKRGSDGKPKKGDDHCCDSFICFASGFDPRYYGDEGMAVKQPDVSPIPVKSGNDWTSFESGRDAWMPENWRNNAEMRKEPWEK